MSEKHCTIVEELKEIIMEGQTGDSIMFKKVDRKVFKVQTDRVKHLKSMSSTEMNNLIKASSV